MIVIVHQAIGIAEPAIPIDHMGEQREELGAIAVIRHDVLPGIPPTSDVVDGTGKLKAEWTSHGAGIYDSDCSIARHDPK